MRSNPAWMRPRPLTRRWGFPLSLALHAVALLFLLLQIPDPMPAGPPADSVELVLVPAASDQAAVAPDAVPATDPQQASAPSPEQPLSADQPPPVEPLPEQAVAAEPPILPVVPPQPAEAMKPPPADVVATPPSPQPLTHAALPPRPPRTASAEPHPRRPPSSPPRNAGITPPASPSSAAPQADPPAAPDPGWIAAVGEWVLAHRSYPEMAKALGRQGTVVLQITVDPNGQVEAVSMLRGSGSESLDQAAQALVRDARLPPLPTGMKLPRQSVTLPIRYKLE